jgi:integrin alpha FG-GAP repeat containing protein 1
MAREVLVGVTAQPQVTANLSTLYHTEAVPVSIPPSTIAQPVPLDVNGNLRLDMIGNVPSSQSTPNSDEEAALTVWSNVWDKTNGSILFDTVPFNDAANSTVVPKCRLGSPHSSAILDFDGDCLADLFLTCQEPDSQLSYHIWLNDPAGGGFREAQSGMLPKGTGMISFGDMGTYVSLRFYMSPHY